MTPAPDLTACLARTEAVIAAAKLKADMKASFARMHDEVQHFANKSYARGLGLDAALNEIADRREWHATTNEGGY